MVKVEDIKVVCSLEDPGHAHAWSERKEKKLFDKGLLAVLKEKDDELERGRVDVIGFSGGSWGVYGKKWCAYYTVVDDGR